MKTIKFEIEVDLSNPAVIAAVNTLFLAIGGHSTATPVTTIPAEKLVAAVETVKETRSTKKVKDLPQVDTEKEKAKEALAELKEEKAAESMEFIADEIETEALAEKNPEALAEKNPEANQPKIDLAKVREALGLKVGEHRETIKAKLTELGANNVTTLSPDHYETMYNFLTGL